MKQGKRLMAWLGIVLILVVVAAFFISAVTGQTHFLAYLYVAWIIPVLLWVFVKIAEILSKYGPAARDGYVVEEIVEPDFGCEGRMEEMTVLCQVKIRHKTSGEEKILSVSEQNLDEEQIMEGCVVKEQKGVLLKIADAQK